MLAKIALKDTDYGSLSDHFKGPVALAMSEDPIGAAKGVVKFSEKNEHLKIICGVADKSFMDTLLLLSYLRCLHWMS